MSRHGKTETQLVEGFIRRRREAFLAAAVQRPWDPDETPQHLPEDIRDALRRYQGQVTVFHPPGEDAPHEPPDDGPDWRKRVALLARQGLAPEAIAERCGVTPRAVRHVLNRLRLLGIDPRAGLPTTASRPITDCVK